MSDLYWLTAIGKLNEVFVVLIIVIGIIIIFMAIGYWFMYGEEDGLYCKIQKLLRYFSISFIVLLALYIFIPNEKQLYTIYGIGSVIDYAKGSKEVQKLPDNAVKCLNIWLEEHSDTTSNKQKYE